MTWDPQQYLQFEDHRLRPAIDLLARVPLAAPRAVIDLGCGTGNVTRLLGERWPQAAILGVDNSATMLARARETVADQPSITFVEAELDVWQPAALADIVYSNAALHWLPDHAMLIPRIAAMVAPGGVLAVQMPDNFRAPSHQLVADLAQSARWRAQLGGLVRGTPTAPASAYFGWLTPGFARVDIWTTEYLQVLPADSRSDHPVAAWTRGTWLVPFLAALDPLRQAEFITAYNEQLAVAYPARADGTVLFPFRRLFIVANR